MDSTLDARRHGMVRCQSELPYEAAEWLGAARIARWPLDSHVGFWLVFAGSIMADAISRIVGTIFDAILPGQADDSRRKRCLIIRDDWLIALRCSRLTENSAGTKDERLFV